MRITNAESEEYRKKTLNAGITIDKIKAIVKAKNISYARISKAININASTMCNVLKSKTSNDKTIYQVYQYVDSVVDHSWMKPIDKEEKTLQNMVHEHNFSYQEAIQILA
jgi:hypothetical protein